MEVRSEDEALLLYGMCLTNCCSQFLLQSLQKRVELIFGGTLQHCRILIQQLKKLGFQTSQAIFEQFEALFYKKLFCNSLFTN